MKIQNETFASLMNSFTYKYDLRPVFDDFLTMSMCAVTQIPGAGKSHYEDLYLKTISRYKEDKLRFQFPKLFSQLIVEMEQRVDDSQGNDVLGDFYELNFCRRNSGQFFTPWPVCQFMAKSICDNGEKSEDVKRVIDPTCGSGRMLLAAAKTMGWGHEYYGIDLDHTCVKMTALNLFLNGILHSEVMCADALNHDDFRISYKLSFLPLGIFRIEQKEQSRLWHFYKNSIEKEPTKVSAPVLKWHTESKESQQNIPGLQLQLF